MIYIYIAIAGFSGAALRYMTGELFFHEHMAFPYTTLTVNIIGTFLLAWITFRGSAWAAEMKKAVGVGFLGSFTTFSALSVETVEMIEKGEILPAVLYILLSVFGGLTAAITGAGIAETGRES